LRGHERRIGASPASLGTSLLPRGLRRRLVLLDLGRRDRVDAAEPAVEIDVSAALAAERAELCHRRLAADLAAFRACLLVTLGHRPDMRIVGQSASAQFIAGSSPATTAENVTPR